MRVYFVDNRMEEVAALWRLSGCGREHELLPLHEFASVEKTVAYVVEMRPDVVLVGFGLGRRETGADIVGALRKVGFVGRIIGNSGGGPAAFLSAGIVTEENVNRDPELLKSVLG